MNFIRCSIVLNMHIKYADVLYASYKYMYIIEYRKK